MKVTLIEPAMIKTPEFSEKPSWVLQPLNLATVAGQIPPDVEVECLDDRLEPIDYTVPRDLVGISVRTFTACRAYQIAARFRARGIPVVLGGHHPTLLPEEARRHADAVVIGEAEELWETVVRDAARGALQPLYRHPRPPSPAAIRTNRAVFAGKKYLPATLLETTRGCPFNCSFCSVTASFGRELRHRPLEAVLAEIDQFRRPLYIFVDDNIAADRRTALDLFRAIRPLRIRWAGQASLTVARDQEMLRAMQTSGCAGLVVGIESIHPESLAQIHKSWNAAGPGIDGALRAIQDHGISVLGSFLLGMDHDTPETLRRTLDFAIEQRLFAALFNVLQPYPGTEMYATLQREGRLISPQWWIDPAYRFGTPAFQPKGMSVAALVEMHTEMFDTFYSGRTIARRLLNWANRGDLWRAAAYLTLNLPARKEETMRTGLPLGAPE